MAQYILGLSAYYHDSAACLLKDGEIVAAAQEERFTRVRHDKRLPLNAIQFCLREGGLGLGDLSAIVFYDKPFLTFERLLETYSQFAPRGYASYIRAMPDFLHKKLFLRKTILKDLKKEFGKKLKLPQIYFSEHHLSHAASAFYASPFAESAVLCLDGVGEWATTTAWKGTGKSLTPLWEIQFPHSLGLLYSAFTFYTGFKVDSGEYKVMGLAPYGEPKYVDLIKQHLIDIKEDGTFRLNMDYFGYCTGMQMTNSKFHSLFGGPPRVPESQLGQKDLDLARSVQAVTEEIMLKLAHKLHRETGAQNLCLAGGVALNCVANGKILKNGPFKNIWIQPAAGDAGGSLGAALALWHQHFDQPRMVPEKDSMRGALLGPSYSGTEIKEFLQTKGAPYQQKTEAEILETTAQCLADGKVVGWFRGRMEFGPRALGSRSIIGDPRSEKMQSIMNLKIKFRESFRPFAPAVLSEDLGDYFDLSVESPYMLLVADVHKDRRIALSSEQKKLWGIDLLNIPKSDIPAVTHVDYSTRVQTVSEESNLPFYRLLKSFKQKTGCSVLVNTSFNVRGEPIVNTPENAFACFMKTEIDILVLENFILFKSNQKAEHRLSFENNPRTLD